MKILLKTLVLFMLPILSFAQSEQQFIDHMKAELENATNDTIRLEINRNLGFYFQDGEAEIGLAYHQKQLELAKKLNLKLWEADAYQQVAYCYRWLDNLPASYENYIKGLKIAEDPASSENTYAHNNFSYSKSPEEARQSIIGMIHYEMSSLYARSRQIDKVDYHLSEALEIGKQLNNKKILSLSTRDIGKLYAVKEESNNALNYFWIALKHYENSPYKTQIGVVHKFISEEYINQKKYDSALFHGKKAIEFSSRDIKLTPLSNSQINLGQVFKKMGDLDSAAVYTRKGIETAKSINSMSFIGYGNVQLSSIYKLQGKNALAYDYLQKGKNLLDSINDAYINRLIQFQNLGFDQKVRLQELEKEKEKTKNKIRTYALLGLGIFLLVVILLYRNNRIKQKANKKLTTTLSDLKKTQSQLVQSEKMASLGELTAGIAHEIQNPLNFVNNFSEVNSELIEEMKEELDKGNFNDVKSLANDIDENEKKIIFHGKRADSIVKGMLQHSKNSTGKKEPTNINALADEYLRLAYHGLRAKDKSFNADMHTDLDERIKSITVIPQDIGRVVLNLVTNAFYAVNEKSKAAEASGDIAYKPLVSIATKKKNNTVEIIVTDNGNGMPESVKEKIFQPFFTTKPTGQGTGLGLSMSYDIVTKGHGGDLKVETKQGEGTTFSIELPL